MSHALPLLCLTILIGVSVAQASDAANKHGTFTVTAPARFQFGDGYPIGGPLAKWAKIGKLPSSQIWTFLTIEDSKYRIVIPWARTGGKRAAVPPPVELSAGQKYQFTFRRDISEKGVHRFQLLRIASDRGTLLDRDPKRQVIVEKSPDLK